MFAPNRNEAEIKNGLDKLRSMYYVQRDWVRGAWGARKEIAGKEKKFRSVRTAKVQRAQRTSYPREHFASFASLR